jgi:histidinol phosphatase-like enzyme
LTTYVFDIDGTICSKVDDGNYENAKPINDRIERVNSLYEQGNTIIFQTARGMGRSSNSQAFAWTAFEKLTRDQLNEWGVKFHGLFLGKPAGDVYIDDKGISDRAFFEIHRKIEKSGE